MGICVSAKRLLVVEQLFMPCMRDKKDIVDIKASQWCDVLVITKVRLRRFVQVECKDGTDWIKCRTAMEAEGMRLRNTWWLVLKQDMVSSGMHRF